MSPLFYFAVGVAFGWIVLPAIRIYLAKRREFTAVANDQRLAPAVKLKAISQILGHCKALKADQIKTIAVSIETYEGHDSFCAFGGVTEDLEVSINVMLHELLARCPHFQIIGVNTAGE